MPEILILTESYDDSIIGAYTSIEKMKEDNPHLIDWTDSSAYTERSKTYGMSAAHYRRIELK